MNGELPKGWIWTSLENIADIVLGQSPPSSTYNEDKIGLPFYQGKSEFGLIYPTPTKWCFSPKKIAESGDVLISVRAPVGPTNICPEKSCIGRGLAAIRGLENINNKFILYLLRNFEEQLRNKATGTTFEAITGNVLRDFEVPLPPLQEQQRIVNKIEELFTNLDKGVESLEEVKYKLKVYRKAILKYAMEGKLTEKWREENKDKIESLGSLINKININSELPKNLPEIWVEMRVKDIGEVVTGTTPSKSIKEFYGDDYPFFKPKDLNKGYYVNTSEDGLSHKGIQKSRILPPKSILVTCIGATIGKTGFTRVEGASNQQINAIIPFKSVFPEFIYFYSISSQFQKNIITNSSSTTLPILNKSKFEILSLSLPPLEEQHKIVERIEQLFSLADYIEETVDAKLEQSKLLRQSILKKAFEGKLVPQDPNDEPAELLLERIKMEKPNKEKLVQEKLI